MHPFASVAAAQINVTVGDLPGNARRILDAARDAAGMGAKLLVCPELALTGYPLEDLALSPAFQRAAYEAMEALARDAAHVNIALLVGGIQPSGDEKPYNAAFLLEGGRITHVQPKHALPNYSVFDEKRVFTPGPLPSVIPLLGVETGILVCEDIWEPAIARHLIQEGAKRLIVINASPYEAGKLDRRHALTRAIAKEADMNVLYVNLIGGQDDLVFDGGSFICCADGHICFQLESFTEQVALCESAILAQVPEPEESIWQAMALGLRDYVEKNRFPGVLLGLSGGLDSAVAAALAVDALGAKRVLGVLLPSSHTSEESNADALESARLLGIDTQTLSIAPGMDALAHTLNPAIQTLAPHHENWRNHLLIGGNMQARLRAVLLMGLSNATGYMLLNTSNKSEIAAGFSTLYGDSCGGYAVLKDVYKTHLYHLVHWRNAHLPRALQGPRGPVIPARTLEKAPSAELAPGQKDEDHLPPYPVLDAMLAQYIDARVPAAEIAAEPDNEAITDVARLVRLSEYKRRQSPPGPKLGPMVFGRDRRYPLTNRFEEPPQ